MNGATAEPWLSTIKPPKIAMVMMTGQQPVFLADAQEGPEFLQECDHGAQNCCLNDSGCGPGGLRLIQ
jgi:hypothetical protein